MESFTVWLTAQNPDFLRSSRKFPDTSGPVWQVPFLLRTWLWILRPATNSRFSSTGSSVGADRTRGLSSLFSGSALQSERTTSWSSPSASGSGVWAGYTDFRRDRPKVTCLFCEQIAHAILADTPDSSNLTQCPTAENSAGMSASHMLDM